MFCPIGKICKFRVKVNVLMKASNYEKNMNTVSKIFIYLEK